MKNWLSVNKDVLSTVLPWILLFIFLNIKFHEDGDVNALSRYAAMRAMTMENTFIIDNVKWSMDWSQAPNGHYYSNKAPGPMLLGYPVMWVIDHLKLLTEEGFEKNYKYKQTIGYEHKVLLPLIYQILPLCFLIFMIARYLKSIDVSDIAITFMVMAILFGNTSSLLMTTWFGHGLATCLLLAMLLSVFHKRWKLCGLFLGLATLSDYGAGLVIPGLALYLILSKELQPKVIFDILIGGILPGVLWIWYHWTNFGGPFSLPNMYQNPKFGGDSLSRQFHLIPIPYFMFVLLFGDERGLLYTQPWVLIILAIGLYVLFSKKKSFISIRPHMVLIIPTFFLLLIMNAAFTGWHGGSTPGPRYLSISLPLLGVLTALVYSKLTPLIRHTLWIFLAISVVFGGLVYGTTILAHEYFTIWTWLLDYYKTEKGDGLRMLMYFISFSAVAIYVFKVNLNVKSEDIYI